MVGVREFGVSESTAVGFRDKEVVTGRSAIGSLICRLIDPAPQDLKRRYPDIVRRKQDPTSSAT